VSAVQTDHRLLGFNNVDDRRYGLRVRRPTGAACTPCKRCCSCQVFNGGTYSCNIEQRPRAKLFDREALRLFYWLNALRRFESYAGVYLAHEPDGIPPKQQVEKGRRE
jgi:hypothetical protein